MTAQLDTPTTSARYLTGRMLAMAWRYRRACLTVVALNTLLVALMVSGLGLTGLAIDYIRFQVDPTSPAPHWPLGIQPPSHWNSLQIIAAIAGGVLLLALLSAALKYATALAGAVLSQGILVQLRSDVYDKLQRLSFHFFDANQSSSLINRSASDVQAVRTFIDGVIVKVLVVMLTLGVYVAYMLSVHVTLTIMCLLTAPLLWYGALLFSRIVQPEYRRASVLVDDLVLTLVENVQGQHVVKGFARQQQEIDKFRAANRKVRDQKCGIFQRISVYQPLMGLLTQVNMLVLIGYGGYLVVRGQLQLGAGLFVFANLLHEFANQVGQITNIANTIQTSLNGAARVFEVLDAPIEIQTPADAVALSLSTGRATQLHSKQEGDVSANGNAALSIKFDHVSFAYRNAEDSGEQELVLQDVSFEVPPGHSLGIVGETGAGKSTLLSLLARFYDPTAGTVLVNGTDVRRLDLDELRRNIGIVFQESFVFSNTVAANIAFGFPDATIDLIEQAAHLAAADEFIGELVDGYETVVGEYGSNLSGGQRQRLAIARALLLDPPILMLDDATASVDPETEHEIRSAINNVVRGRTTLVVSSRISTLRHTDQIIVLHQGRVVQQGTHSELVRQDGNYRRLAELQFADSIED
jgi:ATP-binding cassette subfamily B protein